MRTHHPGAVDSHTDLHSEHGPNRGEHSGRQLNPTIKVTDLALLEIEKPDLPNPRQHADRRRTPDPTARHHNASRRLTDE
jgi:hypothetical protein